MKIVVTGGAGFIGSHLVTALVGDGHTVTVLDNFTTGHRRNLASVESGISVVEGDVRDYKRVREALKGAEVVFHEAALPSVPRSIADPIESTSVNVLGTTTLLKAAVDERVRRVIYAASSSAYGNDPSTLKVETARPAPVSPYAVSKLAGEHMIAAFSQCYGLETVGLRYFNVFGERQDPHSQYSGVIAKFCLGMLRGERPTIHGDGRTSRDFTHVSNVVRGNLLAMEADQKVNGKIINVACGGTVTLLDLVRCLNDILGVDIRPIHDGERIGDVKVSCADITLAKKLLGYHPVTSFREGLVRTVKWYRHELTPHNGLQPVRG